MREKRGEGRSEGSVEGGRGESEGGREGGGDVVSSKRLVRR